MLLAHAGGRVRATVFVANRSTHSVETVTGFVISAVFVVLANTSDASHQGVSLHTGWTLTRRSVVLDETLSTAAAALGYARVSAVFVDAGFIVGTVVVGGTFG